MKQLFSDSGETVAGITWNRLGCRAAHRHQRGAVSAGVARVESCSHGE